MSCQCGASKTGIKQGQAGHSSWCPDAVSVPPVRIDLPDPGINFKRDGISCVVTKNGVSRRFFFSSRHSSKCTFKAEDDGSSTYTLHFDPP